MRGYISALLSITLLASCGGQGSSSKSEEAVVVKHFDFLDSADRKLDVMDLSELSAMSRDSIINPHAILAFDDYVIMADSRTLKALTVYNEATEEYDRVMSRGNANNEIKFAANLGLVSAEERMFFLRDMNQGRVFFMGIDETSGKVVMKSTSNLNRIGPFSDFEYDDNLLIGGVTNNRCRYMVASVPQNRVIARFGDFSAYTFDRDSARFGTISYPGYIALDRANNRFAYLSQRGETIEIGSYDDSEQNRVSRNKRVNLTDKQKEEMSEEEIEEVRNAIYMTDDSITVCRIYNMPKFNTRVNKSGAFETSVSISGLRYGFGSSAASSEYIYSLYDGRTNRQKSNDDDKDDLIGSLCVMDWEGKLLLRITSEYGFKAISYNDSKRRLYCLTMTDTGEYELRYIDQDRLFGSR
ncbi:MAG: BF3164 family lipoprotein [Rikenellaceae bacterium]